MTAGTDGPAQISRRRFIIATAAAGGGLAIGIFALRSSRSDASEQRGAAPPVPGEVYHWVVISPDNTVTIRAPQAETGQGATTVLPQILAEELGLNWSQVRTEYVPISTQIARGFAYGRPESLGNGVELGHRQLRMAGAQIRTMLVRAAARRLGVADSELTVDAGIITHAPTRQSVRYADISLEAATQALPDAGLHPLKPYGAWELIGTSVPRVDAPHHVDGSLLYAPDVRLPGMKYAAIAMCPILGGSLRSFDPSAAYRTAGVRDVVAVNGDLGPAAVAVVADDWWLAKAVLDQVPVVWAPPPLPAVASDEIAFALREQVADQPRTPVLARGSPPSASTDAGSTVMEADYFVPSIDAGPLEPMSAVARVGYDGFEVWTQTQLPLDALDTASKAAVMPMRKGILHTLPAGGAFGRGRDATPIMQATQIAKGMRGVPVKLVWDHEMTLAQSHATPASLSRITAALDASGDLRSWSHHIVAAADDLRDNELSHYPFPYAVPSVSVGVSLVAARVQQGFARGDPYTAINFAAQSFLDEIARASGRDPLELHLSLLDPVRFPPPTDLQPGLQIAQTSAIRMSAVLSKAAAEAGWNRPRATNQGRGIACMATDTAFFAAVADVTLDGSGWFRVNRVVVAGDVGIVVNPDIAASRVEGAVAFGLSSAFYGEVLIRGGKRVRDRRNQVLRMEEMPQVDVVWVETRDAAWGDVDDAPVAAIVPALTNAIYDAGGPRIRALPIRNHTVLPR